MEESKQYIFNEIIQNQNKNQEKKQSTNQYNIKITRLFEQKQSTNQIYA